MDLHLKGHTVLITGAASGIGRATAQAFADEGCSLLLWDCSPHVQQVAQEIAGQFQVAAASSLVDVVDFANVQRALQEYLQRGSAVEHVVHCAAVGSSKFGFPFTNLAPSDWPRTLEVNILGMVNLAHVVTPHLIRSRRGTFVFLASVAGQIGSQTDPPYSASKAANINFAQCMAKDLARHGIRVNTVCPGMVQTPLNRSVCRWRQLQ
jgi:NAD(P)-dependent dehydrogenase (short-subunit alcohol dehydrogenase family)